MSKRFTDTEKWKKAWFRKLAPKYKCAWQFILDNCDHAGVWPEDFEAMSFNVGEEINSFELESTFKGKIIRIDQDKFFVMAFIEFQYGELNPLNKVHKSVIAKLEKYKVYFKGLGSPLLAPCENSQGPYGEAEGAKDMEEDKAKAKDMDKAKEEEREKEDGTIPADILNTVKCTMMYPDAIIEEVRKDAWLKYQASDKPDKNWKRWIGNYFLNEKEKIRAMVVGKGGVIKTASNVKQDAQAMSSRMIDTILRNGMHGLKQTLSEFNPQEIMAIEIFGRASEILSCTDFQMQEIKTRLRNACEESLKINPRQEAG